MKQFNLQEYLANPSRKVVTREGKPARIICTDAVNENPIVALVTAYDNSEAIYSYTKDGLITSCEECNLDLFFEKKEKFDPHTLQPFDKVLIRRYDSVWVANLLSYYYNVIHPDNLNIHYLEFMTISNGTYRQCIPYNEHTKHLVGTTDEAPEYYRYWET